SIEAAITLNGVAVERNIAAFRFGRRLVLDPASQRAVAAAPRLGAVALSASPGAVAAARRSVADRALPAPVAAIAEIRAAELVDYQDAALAERYLDLVGRVARAEAAS